MPSPRRNFQRKRSQLHISFTAPEDIPEPLSFSRAPLPSPALRNSSVADARKATLLQTRKVLFQRRVDAIVRVKHNQEVDHYYYKTFPELHKIYDMMSSGQKLSDAFADCSNALDSDLTPIELHKIPQDRRWEYIFAWALEAEKVLWRMVDSMKHANDESRRLKSELAIAMNDLGFARQFHDSAKIAMHTDAAQTLQSSIDQFKAIREEIKYDTQIRVEELDATFWDLCDAAGGKAVGAIDPSLPLEFDIENPFESIHLEL